MPVSFVLLLFGGLASASEVDVSGRVWALLRPPEDPRPEKGPGPWVSARDVVLTPTDDAVRIRATWSIRTVEPGWIDLPLVQAPVRVDRATLDGRGVALKSLSDGRRHLVAFIERPGELVLEGEVVGDLRRGLSLSLLPAAVGRVQVVTPDPVVRVTSGGSPAIALDGAFWTGADTLEISASPEEPAARSDALVLASVGLGVTVADGDLRVRGRIRWQVSRGELSTVSFAAPGAGRDLEVTGPLVARWERSGDTVTVELRRVARAGVDVEVRWSQPLPGGDEASVPLPDLAPAGVFRTERAVQIARDGDREVVPQLGGWAPTSSAELPSIGRDLVVGTPTSAYTTTGSGSGRLQLLRFTPVSGPPTIVDIAAYDGALSEDGRLLLRAHYTVRNDRGAFLRVRPPPGSRIVGARVGGEPASIALDGDVWLVPLLKSVESVQGLLDFPVDLLIIADGVPFERKDLRELPLPVVDAEVAVSRIELSLPVGWTDRLEPGEEGRVDDFTEGEGITYGFAKGEGAKVAEADALFQDALSAWMTNDFQAAQDKLDELQSIGASNANIDRLKSNVDLVLDPNASTGDGAEVALQRRVKEQARVRANKDEEVQQQLLEEADQAYLSGDYSKAEEAYKQALDIGTTLEQLEQEESVDAKVANEKLKEKLAKSSSGKKRQNEAQTTSRYSGFVEIDLADEEELDELMDFETASGRYRERTEIDFDGVDVTGELVKPQGQLLFGRDTPVDPRSDERMRAEQEAAAKQAAEAARYAEEERRRYEAEAAAAYAESERAGYDDMDVTVQDARIELSPSPPPARSSRGGGGIVIGAKKSAPAMAPEPPPPPPPPPPKDAPAFKPSPAQPVEAPWPDAAPEAEPVVTEGFAPLEVTASTLDVVIPTFGEIVRYQRLLLPAGQAHAVVLHTKKTRGDP